MQLYQGDCLECMKMIPDKSVDLVVMDPPYNIGKAKEWDKFKDADYLKFMGNVFAECGRVMADNGQLYFFHNDITKVTDLMHMLKNFPLVFSSFIVFPKPKFRRLSWSNPTDANNLRSWFNICEFALLYINSKSVHTEWDKTGWDRVRLDVNNFASLRKYAFDMLCYIGGGILTAENKSTETSETEKLNTSSIANLAKRRVFSEVGGCTDHFTRYGSTQWSLATPEVYQILTDKYHLREWSGFREYEDLRREYEDLRPVHNLDMEHCNVWNVKWRNNGSLHPCQKPTEILERMIKCSSKEGATILDPFMGSGSTGVACVNTNRDFIGIELDTHYFDISKQRINDAINKNLEGD